MSVGEGVWGRVWEGVCRGRVCGGGRVCMGKVCVRVIHMHPFPKV